MLLLILLLSKIVVPDGKMVGFHVGLDLDKEAQLTSKAAPPCQVYQSPLVEVQ